MVHLFSNSLQHLSSSHTITLTMANASSSSTFDLPPLPAYTTSPLPPLLAPIPDKILLLLLPVIAYWIVSLFFEWLDSTEYCNQYRLHTPAELTMRNHVTKWECFRDVVLQQVIQTIVGGLIAHAEPDELTGMEDYQVAVWAQRVRMVQRALPSVLAVVGVDAAGLATKLSAHPTIAAVVAGGQYSLTQNVLTSAGEEVMAPAFASWEMMAAKVIYHFAIPAIQFFVGIVFVDTWQYFLHRAMHMNKWLYNTFHSRHHRLYVPYAFGALYNHPFEGFLLDTLGTGIAFMVTGMTSRQGMWFFTCSTIKTIDDHCGYAFPWDPLQHVTENNAAYHDIHHQSWGIKTNFSQPFFTFWDGFLSTKWAGGDVSARYERARLSAQKKVDKLNEAKSITNTNATDSITQPVAPYENEIAEATTLRTIPQDLLSEFDIPEGKAAAQAAGSREQILQDKDAGVQVLAEEADEEAQARSMLTRSMRRKTNTVSAAQGDGLKGLSQRMTGGIHSKRSRILGMESGH